MVLDRIKQYYSLKSNADLARFLGVAPNTITNWYGRKTFDLDVVYTKCVDVDFNWLLTGNDTMLQDTPSVTPEAKQSTDQHDLSGEAAAYYRLYEKKDAEVGQLKEEIGALKLKLSQYISDEEQIHSKGLGTAKDASTKKASSPNADNVTSATAQ